MEGRNQILRKFRTIVERILNFIPFLRKLHYIIKKIAQLLRKFNLIFKEISYSF